MQGREKIIKPTILPSLLAGDFGHMAKSALDAQNAGADKLHFDIMDGHFVKNLTMGPDMVKAIKKAVKIPLHVHLMLTRPDWLLDAFIGAGADTILIHIESQCDIAETLGRIKEANVQCGLVLNPETPAESVFPFLKEVDEVLCMTVHPGFGGQKLITQGMENIRALHRKRCENRDVGFWDYSISVDGGVDRSTIGMVAEAGADAIIAGTAIFNAPSFKDEIIFFRNVVKEKLGYKE